MINFIIRIVLELQNYNYICLLAVSFQFVKIIKKIDDYFIYYFK